MIRLCRLNNTEVLVNPDLLREIESTPDTVLTFVDNNKIMVKESPQEVCEKIDAYRTTMARSIQITELSES